MSRPTKPSRRSVRRVDRSAAGSQPSEGCALVKKRCRGIESRVPAKIVLVLHQMTSKLSRSMSVEQIAHVILETGSQLFSSKRGAVYSYRDHGRDGLYARSVRLGLGTDAVAQGVGAGCAAGVRCHSHGSKLFGENTEDRRALSQMEPRIRAEHWQACAVIPFLIDDQILAA